MYDMVVQGIDVHGRVLGDILRCEYVFEGQKYFVDLAQGNAEGHRKISKRICRRVARDLVSQKINRDEKRFHRVLYSGDLRKERTREEVIRKRKW